MALSATFRHVCSPQSSHLSLHVSCNMCTCYWSPRLMFHSLSLHLSFPVSCNTRTCYRLLRLMFHNPTVPAYLENGFLKKLFLWLPMGWPCLQHSGMLPVNRAHICLLMYPATCAHVTGYEDSCSKLLACICGPACSIMAC